MFNAPDSAAGKRAKCPTCGGVIQIPSSAPVREPVPVAPQSSGGFDDDEFEVEPPAALPGSATAASPAPTGERKRCPACGELIAASAIKCRFCNEVLDKSMEGMLGRTGDASDPGWRKVRAGLATMYYCIVTIFLVVLLVVFGAVAVGAMGGFQNNADPPIFAMILFLLAMLVAIGAGIGILIGQALCTNAPQHSGARGYAIGAIVCVGLNFILSFIGGATQTEALSGVAGLVSMVGNILFILFIRQAATYLGNLDLASSAGNFLIFAVCMFVGIIAIGVAAALAPPIAAILGIALLIAGLVMFIWYLRLIKNLMTTIEA
jgi:hypothetical protein